MHTPYRIHPRRAPGAPICTAAEDPNALDDTYRCTLPAGHGGEHEAHGSDGECYAMWPATRDERTPVRTELLHLLLVRASAGLIARRHDGTRWYIRVDGDPASLAETCAASILDTAGLLVWWGLAGHDGWQATRLSRRGAALLREWDTDLTGDDVVAS